MIAKNKQTDYKFNFEVLGWLIILRGE